MIRKVSSIWMLTVVLTYGCVKDTYDLKKLSGRAELSPSVVLPVFTGKAVLSDAIKQSDTVVYDSDNFVRLVLKRDSVINFGLSDYITVDELVSFSNSYTIGEIEIDPFQGSMTFSLGMVSDNFGPPLRNQFRSLDDGSAHPFPVFPSTSLGAQVFSRFPNFGYAVFSSGFLDVSVTNNFTAPLNGVQLVLSNSHGNVGTVDFPAVNPNQTQTESINLAGITLTDTLTAAVVLSGSPGNPDPAIIDLDESRITFTVAGRDVRVSSGRVIIPSQLVSEAGSSDLISFDPGYGIELEQMKIVSGDLDWHVTYNASLNAALSVTLPTVIRNSVAVTEVINVTEMRLGGTFSLPNTLAAFNSDPAQPYNKIPIEYSLRVNSNNILVDFNSTDQVNLECKVSGAEIDYVKGYFGRHTESFTTETIYLGNEKYIRNISGGLFFEAPSIRINYSNSFAVPIEVTFNGQGRKDDQTVDLGIAPFIVAYPDAITNMDVSSSFTVNKDNSRLPQLISLPPESVVLSGSAEMNPGGDPEHRRNNYIFGNSRFLASVEMELPLEFSLNNLQLTDTTENFLSDENFSDDFNSDDFELVRIRIVFKNGFPFDISAKLSLYDLAMQTVRSTIDMPELLKAAPVIAGKVNGVTETVSAIEVTKEFLDAIDNSDRIIFTFTANTPGAPSQNVKIYSDYAIDFNVTVFLKAKIRFDL